MQDWTDISSQMLGRAAESIELIAITGAGFVQSFSRELAEAALRPLRMRCVLGKPSDSTNQELGNLQLSTAQKLQSLGWLVRRVDASPSSNCLIVDRKSALLHQYSQVHSFEPVWIHYEDAPLVNQLLRHFEELWTTSAERPILYEDLLSSSLPENATRLRRASQDRWNELIRHWSTHPGELNAIDPRRFEELVAELLTRDGMSVELTQQTRDGGRDVLAWADTSAGRHLYLVECKRFAADRPVDVTIARALYGVVEAERATTGILVTTSSFTKDTIAFRNSVQYRLSLKDYKDLGGWLRQHAPKIS